MTAPAPDPFLAGLPDRLALAVGAGELLAATAPPPGSEVRRVLRPASMWLGSGRPDTAVPAVDLLLPAPVDALALAGAWGIAEPLGVSGDVHQSSWSLLVGGPPMADPWGPRRAAGPLAAGRWLVTPRLEGRPPGPLPGVSVGASPAYDLRAGSTGVMAVEVEAVHARVDLVDAGDPEAAALLGAMAARWPHARPSWDLPAGSRLVVVRDEAGRPVAGGCVGADADPVADGTVVARRIALLPEAATPLIASTLIDALEAVALGGGATRLRLDASAFLHGAALPWARHGYVTGPPYDGDGDAPAWAERRLGWGAA